MGTLLGLCAVVGLFAVVLGGLGWAAARVRGRGGGGSLLQPFDEIWHPLAHAARQRTEEQQECPAPAPNPGDLLVPELRDR